MRLIRAVDGVVAKRRTTLVPAVATVVSALTLTLSPIPAVASSVTAAGSPQVSGRVDVGLRTRLQHVVAAGVPGASPSTTR